MQQGTSSKDVFFECLLDQQSCQWHLAGDFYSARPAADLPLFGLAYPGRSDGDFYLEPNDVSWGWIVTDTMHQAFPFLSCLEKISMGDSNVLGNTMGTHIGRFSEAHIPCEVPIDTFFNFELTTLYMDSKAPHEIGNALLDFFESNTVSDLRVKHIKFSFKADVFEKSLIATIKVKVFHYKDRHFAIEFQRRRGDTIAFNKTYKKAVQYLRCRLVDGKGAVDAPDAYDIPALPGRVVSKMSADQFASLLDMAGCEHEPSLQVEAATAVVAFAEDDTKVLLLCKSHVLRQMTILFNNGATKEAHSTARLARL